MLNIGRAPARSPDAIDLDAEADRRRCGALKDFWYVGCLSGELGRRPLGRTILGTPLVLFRDRAGRPAALFDRCLHRNARLSAGVVLPEGLACAYHGWTYDGSGACVGVPSLGPRPPGGLPCDVGRVESFATTEQDGLVYVALVDPAAGARLRSPPFPVPFRGAPGWVVYDMVTRFPNGVTNLVENFMDVPHTAFVHRGWFRNRNQRRIPARVQRHDGQVLVTYQQERDGLSGLGRLFNPRGLPLVHTDHFFVPNVTRVDYRWGEAGFTITSQCTPIGPVDSLVYTAISYRLPLDLPGHLVARALKPLVRWYTRQVIRQDVDIMAVQRDGLLCAPGGGVFQSTEADLLHQDIEAYRGWLRGGAQGPPPADADRGIEFWV